MHYSDDQLSFKVGLIIKPNNLFYYQFNIDVGILSYSSIFPNIYKFMKNKFSIIRHSALPLTHARLGGGRVGGWVKYHAQCSKLKEKKSFEMKFEKELTYSKLQKRKKRKQSQGQEGGGRVHQARRLRGGWVKGNFPFLQVRARDKNFYRFHRRSIRTPPPTHPPTLTHFFRPA
jgi:hypothetical protein